jgi:hypothetical protein
MPKRSTEFQELVEMIKTVASDDAQVTASKMLVDNVTGDSREVDVVVERGLDGDTTTWSIECTEKSRRQPISWIEEMRAKHEWMPTDVLTLVSKNGFTKTALAKAAKYNIRALTPTEVTAEFVGTIVGRLDKLNMSRLDYKDIKRMEVWTVDDGQTEPGPPLLVPEDMAICTADGEQLFTTREFADALKARISPTR